MATRSDPIVLIVDDEPLIRMVAREAFLDAGFIVVEAEHAAAAIATYAASPAHVLFTVFPRDDLSPKPQPSTCPAGRLARRGFSTKEIAPPR